MVEQWLAYAAVVPLTLLLGVAPCEDRTGERRGRALVLPAPRPRPVPVRARPAVPRALPFRRPLDVAPFDGAGGPRPILRRRPARVGAAARFLRRRAAALRGARIAVLK